MGAMLALIVFFVARLVLGVPHGTVTTHVSFRGTCPAIVVAAERPDEKFDGVYVFRRGVSPWSEAAEGFADLLPNSTNKGPIRKFFVVVVPSGVDFVSDVKSVSEAADKFTIVETSFLCHCALAPANDSILWNASSSFGVMKDAFGDSSEPIQYFVFADTDARLSTMRESPAYEIVDPLTKGTRFVLVDWIPGDVSYAPVRRWVVVPSSEEFASVGELLARNPVKLETESFAHVALGQINFSYVSSTRNEIASSMSNSSLVSDSSAVVSDMTVVVASELPLSRMTTSQVNSERHSVGSGLLIFVDGYSLPIVDSIPGDALYSEARAVVMLPASFGNTTSHLTLHSSAISKYYSGRIVDIEVTLEGHGAEAWYRNQRVWIIVYEENLPNGCLLTFGPPVGLLTFVRSNESSPVRRVFTARSREQDEVTYTPFVSEGVVAVAPTFSSLSAIPPLAWSITLNQSRRGDAFENIPNSHLFNAPRKRLNVSSQTWDGSRVHLGRRNSSMELLWRFTNVSIQVQVTLSKSFSLHGAVVLGFHGDVLNTGTFLIAFFTEGGVQCLRQFRGSLFRPNDLVDLTSSNPLQLLARPQIFRSVVGRSIGMRDLEFNRSAFDRGVELLVTLGVIQADGVTNFRNCSSSIEEIFAPVSRFSSDSQLGGDAFHWVESFPMNWSHQAGQTRYPHGVPSLTSFGFAPTMMQSPSLDNISNAAAVVQNTELVANFSKGTFRCDSSFSFSWALANNATNEIEFTIIMSTSLATSRAWFAIGIGTSSMTGSDVLMVYRHPLTNSLLAYDGKCYSVGNAMHCLNDANQNVVAVSVNVTTWVVRRPVRSLESSSTKSDTRATNLVASTISTSIAFGGSGLAVWYVEFLNSPNYIAQDNSVGWAPLYRLRSASDANSTSSEPLNPSDAQASISAPWRYYISTVAPGTIGYSDLRIVVDVFVPPLFVGELPQQLSDIPATWDRRETTRTLNCPMVHASSTLSASVAAEATVLDVRYRGFLYKCVAFLAEKFSRPNRTQRAYQLRAESTNATQDVVFEFTPGDAEYAPFCHFFAVLVPSSLQGSLRTVQSILRSGLKIVDLQTFANFPIVSVSSTPAPTTIHTTSVEEAFTESYQHSQVLFVDATLDEKILLVWNYNLAATTVDVAIIAKNINGYIAIGFSSASTSQMQDADIVMGYVNSATLEGCVRVMYSAFPTSAPSGTATMKIRSEAIQRSGDYLILTFTRDFWGDAHLSGRIPSPSATTGDATGRVLFATLRQFVSAPCVSTEFSPLYHGTSPHGSTLLDWAAVSSATTPTDTAAPQTVAPTTTAPAPATLVPVHIQPQFVYLRGIREAIVCAPPFPISVTESLTHEATADFGYAVCPPMYFFIFNGSVLDNVLPLVTSFPRLSVEYSGAWQVHYVNLSDVYSSASEITNITSLNALQNVVNITVSSFATNLYLDCPIVSPLTTVGVANLSLQGIFFNGQSLACLKLSSPTARLDARFSPASKVAPMWNASTSIVIDDAKAMFFRVLNVNASSHLATHAEDVAGAAYTTGPVVHCRLLTPTNASSAVRNTPLSVSLPVLQLSQRTGWFGPRKVSFYALPSTRGGRCANPRSGWSTEDGKLGTLFVLRNLSFANTTNASSLHDIDTSTLMTLLRDPQTRVPMISLQVRNRSTGFVNQTVATFNTTSNTTSNSTVLEETFVEAVNQTITSWYFADALPGVNASYCDGVWQTVIVDVSSLVATAGEAEWNVTWTTAGVGSNNSSNASGVPVWRRGEYVPADSGHGWFVPWWANAAFLRTLPHRKLQGTPLGSKLHCPLINRSSEVTGNVMQRLSVLTVGGFTADCLNFGWLDEAPVSSVLPNLVNVSASSTALLDAIPGSRYFSSIFWMRNDRRVSSGGVPALNESLLSNATYQVAYVFVVSVTGSSSPMLSSLHQWNISSSTWRWASHGRQIPTTGLTRLPTDPVGTFALHQNTTRASLFPESAFACLEWTAPTCTSVAVPMRTVVSSLSSLYLFRRGKTIDSHNVSSSTYTQRPLCTHTPNESYYHFSNGSWGYTDMKRLIVVTVPRSYAGAEISSVHLIPPSWTQTAVSSVVGHTFLGVVPTGPLTVPSSSGFPVWCPSTMVWVRGVLMNMVDCGRSPTPSDDSVAEASFSGGTASPLPLLTTTTLLVVGSRRTSIASFVPLHMDNIYLRTSFLPMVSSVFRQSGNDAFVVSDSSPLVEEVRILTIPQPFPIALPESGEAMDMFVFRSGPVLSSSGDLAPPVFAWGGSPSALPSISNVFVVNVGSFTSDELFDMELQSVDSVRAAALENCWPILETNMVEAGAVIYVQSDITDDDLVQLQPYRAPANRLRLYPVVYVDGVARKRIASRLLVSADAALLAPTPNALEAADGSLFLAPQASPSWIPLVRVMPHHHEYVTFRDRSQLVGSVHTLVSLLGATFAASTSGSTCVIAQVVDEAYAPYVPLPTTTSLRRQTAWFGGGEVAAYVFDDRNIRHPEVPSPLYVFRRLGSNGAVLSLVGNALADALPGHAWYNDLHEIIFCDIPATSPSSTQAATSMRALRAMMLSGKVLAPKKSGTIKLTPIVAAGTTVEAQDRVANGGMVIGPTSVSFEGTTLGMLDFGITTVGFNASLSTATRLIYERNHFPVPAGIILNTAPWANASTFSFVRSMPFVVVPNWVLPGTVTSDAAAAAIAIGGSIASSRNVSVAVIPIASSATDSVVQDDANISLTGPTPISWMYGSWNFSEATGVITREAATRIGGGTIDFVTGNVTGSAAITQDWLNITNQTTSISLGEAVDLSWQLGTLGGTSAASTSTSRLFEALSDPVDIATYAPSELYAQFRLTVRSDVWVGLGISESGGMSGADIWIAYASRSVPAGAVSSGSFHELSDRHANPTSPYTTPIRDTINNLEMQSLELTSSGYAMVFRRKLITGDDDDISIQNSEQTMIWAYGPYQLHAQTPSDHTNRGVVVVNFFNGQNLSVEQRTFSFWYVAVLLALSMLAILIGFLARLLSPGYLMFKRPLLFMLGTKGIRRMTVGELLVLAVLWGVGGAWGYGCFSDFQESRRANSDILALGSTAQYFLYFAFMPLARNNILLTGVFRSSWHKLQHWTSLLLLPALILAWVHGGVLMYRRPDASFHTTKGVCSIVGLSALTFMYLVWHSSDNVRRGVLRPFVSMRRQHTLYHVFLWAAVALLCIHTPKLALGFAPWFLATLLDHALRWKAFRTRFGTVVAQGVFGDFAAAIELRVFSPWRGWWTRAFVASPAQFVLLDIEGVEGGPLALSLSTRALQDPKLDFASTTFHLKPPRSDAREQSVRERVRRLAAAGTLQGRFCRVEGPYGGIGLRLRWYRSLLLIGGGVGASTCISLLEAMTFQPDFYTQDTSVEMVTLVLIGRTPEELAVFATELYELLGAPRPFDLQVLLHCTSPAYHLPPTAQSNGNFHSLVDVASPPRRNELPQSNPSEVHPLFEHVPIFFHRPNWVQLITSEQIAVGKRGENRLAVHVNGPSSLTSEVLETCDTLSCFHGVQIHVDYEQYDLCV